MKLLSPALSLTRALLLQPDRSIALIVSPPCHLPTALRYHPRQSCIRHHPVADANDSHKISASRARHASGIALQLSAAAQSDGGNTDATSSDDATTSFAKPSLTDSSTTVPLALTLTTGVVTSLIGFLYGKCMNLGFGLLWKSLPSYIFRGDAALSKNVLVKLLRRYPALYIVMMVTCGGGMVATLSSQLPHLFSAHDYVHILSSREEEIVPGGTEEDVFPSSRLVFPVMGLCLLTSISGFSLGPEAPMVTVGSLIGASLARKFWNRRQCDNPNSSTTTPSIPSKSSLEKTLAYAGAAGSLTGFMNIPIAGPIFALEMTSRKAGFARSAVDSFSTAILASLAGIAFVRGIMLPHVGTGGHFHYVSRAAVGLVTGREMILVGLGCGLGGAMVGTSFHAVVRFLKGLIWSKKKDTRTENAKKCEKYLGILKMTFVAFMIGMLSTQYPQTMFWGEGSLQCMISGQCTPFAATPHGLPISMMQWAKVNPNIPLTSWFDAIQVGMAKFFAISLASAGMFPGGVIFPLLSNGAGLSRALIEGVTKLVPSVAHSVVSPMMVMSFMAATLTSITRTPLATCLILSLTASGITPLSVLLPGALLASYVSVFVSEKLSKESFFKYSN